jgi:hypothetical protein
MAAFIEASATFWRRRYSKITPYLAGLMLRLSALITLLFLAAPVLAASMAEVKVPLSARVA